MAATIIVVLAVVGGLALLVFNGNIQDLLASVKKSATDVVETGRNGTGPGDASEPPADSQPADVIDSDPGDVPESGDADVAAAVDSEDRDDGHWRDRRRADWQDPCWSGKGAFGTKPAPENNGRLLADLCDVEMPFPKSVGFKMKPGSGGIGSISLTNGAWECLERDQPDGEIWSCGEIHLSDVAYVDFDDDGQKEVAAYFMSNYGGNCESYQIYAYEIAGKRPKFKGVVADNDAYSCEERSLNSVEPLGKHCVKALTNCDKTCHGCDGTPCYDIFAWTGSKFEIAESWQDANSETRLPGSVETRPELMKLCGID